MFPRSFAVSSFGSTSGLVSGKVMALPPPPPLRTGHDGFLSSGSSRSKPRRSGAGFPDRFCLSCCLYEPCLQPSDMTFMTGPVELVPIRSRAGGCTHAVLFACSFAISSCVGSACGFVMNYQLEVGLLSQRSDVATPVRPITGRHSLSPASSARRTDSGPCGHACLMEAVQRVYPI